MAHRTTLRLPLALGIALAGCAPAPRQDRGALSPAPVSPVPQAVRAPEVPALEGIPQAVRVGLTVYLSGMVPVDSAGRIIGTTVGEQARQAMANLAAVVRAAHGVRGDVVRVTIYLRDASPANVEAARAAVLAALDPNSPPAVTVIGVTQLPEATMQVMLDGIAQLRSEFPDRNRMAAGRIP